MSVETTSPGGPPFPHDPLVLILAVTVIAFAAIVILALAGHPYVAGAIGPV
jgi:hypothetical protein